MAIGNKLRLCLMLYSDVAPVLKLCSSCAQGELDKTDRKAEKSEDV